MNQLIFLLLFIPQFFFQQQTEWNYFTGGNDWHKIWPTCSSTKGQQSPIDIPYNKVKNVTQAILSFDQLAQNVATSVENNGYFLKSDFPWMKISVNDNTGKVRKAQCISLSFHAPSEHIIEGNRFNMEIQFTCEDITQNGKFINLAILCESERFQENKLIDKFAATASLLKNKGEKAKIKFHFEKAFMETLKNNNLHEYFTYTGTFTSPPCHHSIAWVILSKPIKISDQTLSQFQALWAGNTNFAGGSGNYRNIQILHDHTQILLGTIQESLIPLDISEQIYATAPVEDTNSDEYYQQKIQKNLQTLENQRAISSYQIKAKEKVNFLTKTIEILTNQYNEQLAANDGSDLSSFYNKIQQLQLDLNNFKTNCMEYSENSNCNIEIPKEEQLDDSTQQQIDPQQKKEAIIQSQELSDTKSLKPQEEMMITHDGQSVTMKIPDDLQFLQTSKKKFR